MTYLNDMKKHLFPRGLRRDTARLRSRFFNRTGLDDFAAAFKTLDFPENAVICIHARLSSFGFLTGGPEIVIRALQQVVPNVTIIIPTFPFSRTMQEYIAENPVFDAGRTPSKSGLLSETFRNMPRVLRSCHPTHPSAALGPEAGTLIRQSEWAQTPFGDQSAYGRYTSHPQAFQLLLDTNSTSIVHRFQEITCMPNLFLDDPASVRFLDATGRMQTSQVKIHRPRLPLFIPEPDGTGQGFQYIWMPDYCLLFPQRIRKKIINSLHNEKVADRLINREESFFNRKIFRSAKIGKSEILAIHVPPWLTAICRDLSENMSQNASAYKLETMQAAMENNRFLP